MTVWHVIKDSSWYGYHPMASHPLSTQRQSLVDPSAQRQLSVHLPTQKQWSVHLTAQRWLSGYSLDLFLASLLQLFHGGTSITDHPC